AGARLLLSLRTRAYCDAGRLIAGRPNSDVNRPAEGLKFRSAARRAQSLDCALFGPSIPRTERLSKVRRPRGERGIGQHRFWEHLSRDDEGYGRLGEYCYINPVKHGLVTRVRDWPFSSFHRDVAAGLFPQDWAGDFDALCEFGEARVAQLSDCALR